MATNPHSVTHTRPGSTRDLGYHGLADYAGRVPSHLLTPPAPATPAASFGLGVADATYGQPHHVLRDIIAGYVVGRMVGQAIARVRYRP